MVMQHPAKVSPQGLQVQVLYPLVFAPLAKLVKASDLGSGDFLGSTPRGSTKLAPVVECIHARFKPECRKDWGCESLPEYYNL